VTSYAARIEAVWFVRFTFDHGPAVERQDGQMEEFGYHNLSNVDVAPGFPYSEAEEPEGLICRNIEAALTAELDSGLLSTLADLLRRASAMTSDAPPPGFTLLVRYVSALSLKYGGQPIQPTAVPYGGEPSKALEGAEVVHLGPKPLLLRLPGADSVLKVAPKASIARELSMHNTLDAKMCRSLRPLSPSGHGSILGAGEGLCFLELQHWCKPAPPVPLLDKEACENWWNQVSAGEKEEIL